MQIVTVLVVLYAMSVMAAPRLFPGSRKRLHPRNSDPHSTKNLKPVTLTTTEHLTVGVANATWSSLYPEPTEEIVVVTTGEDLDVKVDDLSQMSSSVEILEWHNLGEASDREMVAQLKKKGILTAVSSMSVPCKKEARRAIPDPILHSDATPDVMISSSKSVSLSNLLDNISAARFSIQLLINEHYCVHKDVKVVSEELNLSCEEFQEKFNESHWPTLSSYHTEPTNATYVLNDLLQGHLSYRAVLYETIPVQKEFSCCNKSQCYYPQYCIDDKLVNALECDWRVWQEGMDDALERFLHERAIGTYYEVMRESDIEIYAKAEEVPAHQELRPRHYPILYTAAGLYRHLHQMELAEYGLGQLCHNFTNDNLNFNCF